jgi:hypothetical protein
MNYVESDVPDGMTLAQWRKLSRPARGSWRWWRWLAYGRRFLNPDARTTKRRS